MTYVISNQDYKHESNGQSHYLSRGELPRSNGPWIELTTEKVTIPPHQSREMFFRLNVPNDATLRGTYSSIFLIEPVEEELELGENEGMRLRTIIRYGRIFVTHIGPQNPEITMSDIQVGTIEDKNYVIVNVDNKGNSFYSFTSVAKIFDESGTLVKEITTDKETLLPDNSNRLLYPVDSIEAGNYRLFIILTDESGKKFGTRANLKIE